MTPLDTIIVMFLLASLGLIAYMVMLMQRLIVDLEADTKTQKIIASRMAANKNVKKLPRPPLPPPPRPETLDEDIVWE
jgi:hypothetical protein